MRRRESNEGRSRGQDTPEHDHTPFLLYRISGLPNFGLDKRNGCERVFRNGTPEKFQTGAETMRDLELLRAVSY